MGYTLGAVSKQRLDTCHQDIVKVMTLAASRSKVDFGIAQGARSWDEQLDYFIQGKSKLDPRVPSNKDKAKHVVGKGWREVAHAVDIFGYHPDIEVRKKMAYDVPTLAYIAGVVDACSEELFTKGEITHKIRWGGNWDGDGIIMQDQSFQDLPHFELI